MKRMEQDGRPARLWRILKQLRSDEEVAEFLSVYDGYCADFAPEGAKEESLVAYLALLALCIRNCALLESDVVRRGMEATANTGDGDEMAVGRALIHDFEGANELEKLSRYARSLQNSQSLGLRRLENEQEKRKRRPKSGEDIQLEMIKPCTSVVQ